MIHVWKVAKALRKWSNNRGHFTKRINKVETHCAIGGLALEAGIDCGGANSVLQLMPSARRKLQEAYGLTRQQLSDLMGLNDRIEYTRTRRRQLVTQVCQWGRAERAVKTHGVKTHGAVSLTTGGTMEQGGQGT